MNRGKAIGAGALLLLCMLASLWPSRSERILLLAPLSEAKGEEGVRRLQKELAACGPEATGPILRAIQRHNPFDRDWLRALPSALRDLGEPAHHALLECIHSKPHNLQRTRLIVALHAGFSDYSCFELWLTNAVNGAPAWYLNQFAAEIGSKFSQAPRMQDPQTVSGFDPSFVRWWITNSRSPL